MAKVIAIGEPVNESEREAIAILRDHLSDGYFILHNFEIARNGESFEVDIAVVAPHAVYLIDVKGTRGLIDVYGSKWYPEGRQPFNSPLAKLRSHARTLKGIITASQPGRRELEEIYVDAIVILTSPDASLVDQSGRDGPSVVSLKKAVALLQNTNRIPAGRSKNIAVQHKMVLAALQGASKPRSGPLRFGNWEVQERLGGIDTYSEYRGFNLFAGPKTSVLIRVYQADPYRSKEERESQRQFISNSYRALSSMPGHPNIVTVRDFFATEGEDKYVLVTEDVPGQALKLHIEKHPLALTIDQKLRIAKDLLQALKHLEESSVVHRNITPSNILVGTDGRSRLSGFDYARSGTDRSRTIAGEIVDDLEPAYLPPELHGEPGAASAASDMFSVGLVLYELFTGVKPFATFDEMFSLEAKFPMKPSEQAPDVLPLFDSFIQMLCTFDPADRPSAADILNQYLQILASSEVEGSEAASSSEILPPQEKPNFLELSPQTQLTPQYVVEKRLGKPGGFGVAYKVIDTLGDVSRVMKLILHDRHSLIERLKKEYRTLLKTPDHPHVVKVIHADFLPGNGPPFIVFEFIDGLDVGEMIEGNMVAPEDALELAKQVASGLVHLHAHGVYHCDIKPRNLLWTDRGVKIIDFNVAVQATNGNGHGGGSRRYLPPDLDLSVMPSTNDLVDRDLYALGLTLYEALTFHYPWDTAVPPPSKKASDPRDYPNLGSLSPEFVDIILRAISPRRADRFASAQEFQAALGRVQAARRIILPSDSSSSLLQGAGGGVVPPNTNPFVRHLLTVYSQSPVSNSGTRGLDSASQQTYIETALDRELLPSVLKGDFKLVIISGNAGDGKTAFLQRLEKVAEENGALVDRSLLNGSSIELQGRKFLLNYDGSQDEGDKVNDLVLRNFFTPFAGSDNQKWPTKETRLIAINEGRLVDFFQTHGKDFPKLAPIVKAGFETGKPDSGVAVVNLNLRSVVADPFRTEGDPSGKGDDSIFARLLRRMTQETFWEPCAACDLKDRCYAYHNAKTFQDNTAGGRVIERLKTLYTLTHLRGKLHITLRDLRSALAYMLVGTRDCDQIHELYRSGERNEIAQGFYFNSWKGPDGPVADRLLSLLREIDIGDTDEPRLDRSLDFMFPSEDRSLFRFDTRGNYDRDILQRLYNELPRDISGKHANSRVKSHKIFISMTRRRAYFERRDSGWRKMLPYKNSERLLTIMREGTSATELLEPLLIAINRGEGLSRPEGLGKLLALQVRRIDGGTAQSYRLYPIERFSISLNDISSASRFIESMPTGIVLRYSSESGLEAELSITLDVFEMLQRLNEGYRPSVEEEQGYYQSLTVFKNLLGSAPYQELVVSTSGYDFYKISRATKGTLTLAALRGGL